MSITPEQFRQRAMDAGMDRASLDRDPLVQFDNWYQQAVDLQIVDANALSLATVDAGGQPALRTVLLKHHDQRGFVFFTNYQSRKACDIAANPAVALLFPWIALGRQVKVKGRAAKISFSESVRYFLSRPRGSQIGAWASPQSQVIENRGQLDARVEELERSFAGVDIPLPSFWGGYRVWPHSIEFWQSRRHRLHDRFLYTRVDDGWRIERLAP